MSYSPVTDAIELLQQGKVSESKKVLNISDGELSDSTFIEQLSSLSTGLDLITSDKVLDSIEHFQNSLKLVEKSNDEEAKILVPILIRYGQGLDKLHSGDAFGAYQLFQHVADATEKLAFFDANLQRVALSAKATASIALARTNIAAGNVDEAQKWMAFSESTYEEVLKLLNEDNPNDYGSFVEAYGLPVEIGAYWAFFDLQVLEIDEALNHLELCRDKYQSLKKFSPKLSDGPTKNISIILLKIYDSTEELCRLSKKLFFNNETLDADDLEKIKSIINDLSRARQLALQAGKRGHGTLWQIKQLKRFAKNLISAKSINKKEISKFSGLISFVAFVIILVLIKLLFEPGQVIGFAYYFGALVLSLIVGFGYGAIKFYPLLNTYKEVLKEIKQD